MCVLRQPGNLGDGPDPKSYVPELFSKLQRVQEANSQMQQAALSQPQEEPLGYFQRFSHWVQSDQFLGFTLLHWEPGVRICTSLHIRTEQEIAIGTASVDRPWLC